MRYLNRFFATLALAAVSCAGQARFFSDLTEGTTGSFPVVYGESMPSEYLGGDYYAVIDCRVMKMDGATGVATTVFTNTTPATNCNGRMIGRAGNRFLFLMAVSQLWSSDGTTLGTIQLPFTGGDIASGVFTSAWPRWPGWYLVTLNQGTPAADAVWITDGTVANTRLLQTTGNGASVAFLADGRAALLGSGVWAATTPTANATAVVTNAFSDAFAYRGISPNDEGRTRVFFQASTPAAGYELWSSDLTLAGTGMVLDHTPGAANSFFSQVVAPYDDARIYFEHNDQLYRTTLGSGTGTKLNPPATAVSGPIVPIGGDVAMVTMGLASGNQLWKLRDAAVPTFGATSGGPGIRPENPVAWLAGWPDRTIFGSSSTEAPFGAFGVVPVAAPDDIAFTGLVSNLAGSEKSSFRGDVYFAASPSGDSIAWRRNADGPDYVRTNPQNEATVSNFFAPRGGPLQLYARTTNATGREPHAADLVRDGVPMCNVPGMKIADNASTSDTIEIPGQGVIPSHRVLDARVHVKVQHSYVGDLTISLEHVPTARSVVLMQRPVELAGTCASDDLDVVFDDAAATSANDCAGGATAQAFPRMQPLLPREPLSEFIGGVYQGEWRLTVADGAGGDIGGLAEWCLELSVGALPVTMFRDGFE